MKIVACALVVAGVVAALSSAPLVGADTECRSWRYGQPVYGGNYKCVVTDYDAPNAGGLNSTRTDNNAYTGSLPEVKVPR